MRTPKTVAPTLVRATVGGTEVKFLHSEDLDTGTVPHPDAFSVTVASSSSQPPTGVPIPGRTVTLILSTAAPPSLSPTAMATVVPLTRIQSRAIEAVVLPQATGGNGALVYSLTAGAGLTFGPATRQLSGTPTGASYVPTGATQNTPPRGRFKESPMLKTLLRDAIGTCCRLTAIALSLLLLTTDYAASQEEDFAAWVAAFHQEALAEGIGSETLDTVLPGLTFRPRVVELDRRQPEGTLTYAEYLSRVLPTARVNRGKRLLRKHRALLTEIGDAYGVQPRFIVALWGIESDFGRVTGGFPVLDALATLAFDGRRGEFFRGQLLDALRIVDDGHIQPDKMMGSWAGAMGQSQFMPLSFQRFAVDHDGDGRRDIWGTLPDVFASAANYLARAGWKHDQTWGRRVRLPAGFDLSLKGLKVTKPLGEWQALGVRRSNGNDLPTRQLPASLILPGSPDGPAFLTYPNYRVLLKWNRSHYFATTVGQFADLLATR